MILYTKDAGGAGREQMAMQKYLTFMNRNDLITSLKEKQKNLTDSLKENKKNLTDSSPFSRWNMLLLFGCPELWLSLIITTGIKENLPELPIPSQQTQHQLNSSTWNLIRFPSH